MSGLIKRTEKLSKSFAEGVQVELAGGALSANPHLAGSEEEAAWDEGFESSGTTTPAIWEAVTAYVVGDLVFNDEAPTRIYECIVAGTSAASGGPLGKQRIIADDTASWRYVTDSPLGAAAAADWVADTAYIVGDVRENNSNIYICVNAGDSAQVAETGWIAETTYTEDVDSVSNDVTPIKNYLCKTTGDSDTAGGPTGRGTGIVDATTTWDFVADVGTGPASSDKGIVDNGVIWDFVQVVGVPIVDIGAAADFRAGGSTFGRNWSATGA